MTIKRFLSLTLCLLLVLMSFTSCANDNATDYPADSLADTSAENTSVESISESTTAPLGSPENDPFGDRPPVTEAATEPTVNTPVVEEPITNPQTLEDYLTLALRIMKSESFCETSTKTTKTTYAGSTTEETTIDKTHFQNVNGNYSVYSSSISETVPFYTYYNGTTYAPLISKKCEVDYTAMLESGLASVGIDEEWVNSFKYKNVSITKEANGNIIISGVGADEKITENPLLAGLGALGSIDFDKMKATVVLDSNYRLISQSTSYSSTVMGMMNCDISVLLEYEYGPQFAIANPESSATYSTVATFNDLITELATVSYQ